MGAPGRKPKPTHMKVLAGNPGKRPLNEREPKPKAKIPRVPAHLQGEARREWRRMAKKLFALGLLTEIDGTALALYCQAWARWVEAEEEVRKLGAIVKSPNGYPIQNPYLSVANRAMRDLRAMLVEFGMTPSSRSRVQVNRNDEGDDFFGF